jgi:hypothetical protein
MLVLREAGDAEEYLRVMGEDDDAGHQREVDERDWQGNEGSAGVCSMRMAAIDEKMSASNGFWFQHAPLARTRRMSGNPACHAGSTNENAQLTTVGR